MNAHALSYGSLQRRLIAERRSRALFFLRTTQHVGSARVLLREVARALIGVLGVALWGAAIVLLAA
jgi:hypothetical protein